MSQRARSSSPISFEIARTSTAGTPASAAARRTPKPSIASTSGACDETLRAPPTAAEVWIGRACASGQCGAERGDELSGGCRAVDDRPLGREVAVDGLRADDERPLRDPPRAGEADVKQRGEGTQGERACRGGCRLDRPDAADEAVVTAELAVGRGDEEDRGVGGPQSRDPTVRATAEPAAPRDQRPVAESGPASSAKSIAFGEQPMAAPRSRAATRASSAPHSVSARLSVVSCSCRSNGLKSAPICVSKRGRGAEQRRGPLSVPRASGDRRRAPRGTTRCPPCPPSRSPARARRESGRAPCDRRRA